MDEQESFRESRQGDGAVPGDPAGDPAEARIRAEYMALRGHGSTSRAIELFQELLTISPSNVWALSRLAQSMCIIGRHEEAIGYATRCLRLDPTLGTTRLFLAKSLRELGRFEQAVAEYRTTAAVMPGLAGPLEGLAETLRRARRFGEARAAYEELFRMEPGWRERSLGYAAVLLELGEGADEATEILRRLAKPPGSLADRKEARRILSRTGHSEVLDWWLGDATDFLDQERRGWSALLDLLRVRRRDRR
jgi:tetratricopeptide (TPR) repeat protein